MSEKSSRGSLLFELFIALMILSIGLTSTLRVFGETLFAGQKNRERLEAEREVKKLLFRWFAYPSQSTVPESGNLTVPFGETTEDSTYWLESRSEHLVFKGRGVSEKELEETKSQKIQKPSPYYQVHLRVSREGGKPVFDLDTVVLKSK